MSTLGKRMKARREELNMSLSELARRTGISRSYLNMIEGDESSPTLEKVELIALELGLTVFFPDHYPQPDGSTEAYVIYMYRTGQYTHVIRMMLSLIDERGIVP